jgi:hypothetical protein
MTDTILSTSAGTAGGEGGAATTTQAATVETGQSAQQTTQAAQPTGAQSQGEPAKRADNPTNLLAEAAAGGDDPLKGFDWRAAMSRGDAKKLAQLGRFADLGTLADAFFDTRTKLSQRDVVLPGADAAPEEIAAFRQKLGIPDSPDAYEFPGTFSDGEKGAITGLKAALHSAHAPPQVVGAIAQWYSEQFAPAVQAEREAYAKQFRTETRAAMIEEMGPRDFERGVKLANQFVIDRLGNEEAASFLGAELTDGTRIGDNPAVLKLLINLARDYAGDDLVAAVEAPDAKSVQARIDDLMALSDTDRKRYESQSVQDELLRLIGIRDTRAARRAA